MERTNAWKKYREEDISELEKLASDYIDFISDNKTERECATTAIARAEACGYKNLGTVLKTKQKLKAGDKIWAHAYGKALILVHLGTAPLEEGLNILGAHIDSPRLDVKQNPLYETNDLALLDTHYYGGIKKYQWMTTPLAIHGVIVKKAGDVVQVNVGEDPSDPVFCVTDLLPHLARQQMAKQAGEFIEGDELDILVGSRPTLTDADIQTRDHGDEPLPSEDRAEDKSKTALEKLAEKEPVKAMLLQLLGSKYDVEEEDFLSAELEVVPAGRARECGFDRSMVIGYGQDDRVCAFTSLLAQLAAHNLKRTGVCVLVDKEEIGSVGATGMASMFFENTIAEVMALTGDERSLSLRRCLASSNMLSSDVSAAFDPTYAFAYEAKNAAYCGKGLVFNKFTGSGGKSGSNDANAEYMAKIRSIMDAGEVSFQTAELGKVDVGGGGTIAYIPAKYGMNVIDSGVAVLSMHAPWEVTSKADIYEAYKGYQVFLREA
ncbi:MAG: aminopeptidase [Raoultibacter sp.]